MCIYKVGHLLKGGIKSNKITDHKKPAQSGLKTLGGLLNLLKNIFFKTYQERPHPGPTFAGLGPNVYPPIRQVGVHPAPTCSAHIIP
jgi:hypothetical protein